MAGDDAARDSDDFDDLDLASKLALIKGPDPEEVRASYERRYAHKAGIADLGGFRPFSLEDWLSLCAKAGVEAIPSTVVGRVPMRAFCFFDSEPGFEEAMSDAGEALAALKAADPDARLMARWDGCGDMWLKMAMNHDGAWSPERAELPSIDDERAYETHAIYMPRHDVPIHVRPWVDAVQVDGMPLEFRVYVEGGRVVGVSNYHYQRPLRREPWVVAQAEACQTLAERLLAAQDQPVRLLSGPDDVADPSVNAWTADFVVVAGRGPVFLEGGPPVAYRASPCCFRDRGRIEGLALALAADEAAGASR